MQRLHVELELPFMPARLQDHTWCLEKLGNLVTYERCIAALHKLAVLSTLRQGTLQSNLRFSATCIAGANFSQYLSTGDS